MICDEIKPGCIVRLCCSERCVEVNNVIEDNQRNIKPLKDIMIEAK